MSVTLAQPGEGWRLQVKMRFVSGGMIFNRGNAVKDISVLGRNWQSFFEVGRVAWVPPSTECIGEPIPVEASPSRLEPIKVIIAPPCGDLVVQRNRSVHETAKVNGVPLSVAAEHVMYSKEAGDMWKRAAAVEAEHFSNKNKLWGRKQFVQPDFTNIGA